MNMSRLSVVCAGGLILAMTGGCSDGAGTDADTSASMPNPASQYCVKMGGKLEIVKDKSGNESGMCHLPDGTVIEEWKLFRRDHKQQETPPHDDGHG